MPQQRSIWLQAQESAEDVTREQQRLHRHWQEISADGVIDLVEYRTHERLHDDLARHQRWHLSVVTRFRAYVYAAIHLLNTGRAPRDLAREYPELQPAEIRQT